MLSSCIIRLSIFKDTIIKNAHLSIIKNIKIFDMWLEEVSFDLIATISNVDLAAVSNLCSKLRDLKAFGLYPKKINTIGGECSVVEIDESKFGKRKQNKGHKVERAWIVGAAERKSRKIILMNIENSNCLTLAAFCKRFIHKKSIVFNGC